MRQLFFAFLLISTIIACKYGTYRENLIGKWNPTYFVKNKDSKGHWGPWNQISTFAPLPTLEFTADKRILWDGKAPESCCTYKKFDLNKKTIILKDGNPSQLCDCALCTSWKIEKLNETTLEINLCYSIVRYARSQ
jgi:hypothetical protein